MVKILLLTAAILAATLFLVFIWPSKPEEQEEEPVKK